MSFQLPDCGPGGSENTTTGVCDAKGKNVENGKWDNEMRAAKSQQKASKSVRQERAKWLM